ncbi:MAG: hypothetical protein ACE141_14435, partial [Bryobacteraceae bacterium]
MKCPHCGSRYARRPHTALNRALRGFDYLCVAISGHFPRIRRLVCLTCARRFWWSPRRRPNLAPVVAWLPWLLAVALLLLTPE